MLRTVLKSSHIKKRTSTGTVQPNEPCWLCGSASAHPMWACPRRAQRALRGPQVTAPLPHSLRTAPLGKLCDTLLGLSLLSHQGQDSLTGTQLSPEPGSEHSVGQMLRKVAVPERPQVTGASSESGCSGDRKNRGGTCHAAVLVALPSKARENHACTANTWEP